MLRRAGFVMWLCVASLAIPAACPAQTTFSHALIQASCAPWDGPAVEIRLTTEAAQCKSVSGPYIDMGVWRGLPIHAGQVVKFGSTSNDGFASRCAKVGECERAESGTITFDTYQDGSGATGRYKLRFKTGEVSGSFDAKWCENQIICR